MDNVGFFGTLQRAWVLVGGNAADWSVRSQRG